MDFELPPDPYSALGLAKSATSAEIKKAWQKLVLKCHPDKVSDEAAKIKANDEFHKVQSAYELIGDDASRERYHAQLRIHELRKQNEHLRGSGGHAPRYDVRTAAFDVRTAAPPHTSYATRGPPRYHAEERRPSYYGDDETPRSTARKYSTAEYAYVKRPALPKARERERERERERVRTSSAEERRKAERKRDVEEKESRARKFETRQEDFLQYEEERRRRDRDEAERKKAAEASRPNLRKDDTTERMRMMEEEARKHMQAQERPEFIRTTSSRDIPQYTYIRRSAGEPKEIRRTRGDSPPRGTASTRRAKEEVEPFETRPATLKQQTSAPPKMASSPRETRERDKPEPHRSYTTQTDYERRKTENEPPVSLPRANSMPTVPGSSARKSQPSQPSKLRTSEPAMPPDSGYSSPATPEKQYTTSYPPPPPPAQPNTTRTTYHYPSGNTTSAAAGAYEYSNGHRVQIREPTAANSSARRVARSPSPIRDRDRDVKTSSTAQKMAHLASGNTRTRSSPYSYSETPASRPPMAQTSAREVPRASRSPDRRDRRRERDRYRDERPREKLYGEMGPGLYRGQPTSYRPDQISFSKPIRPEDVIYSSRQRSSQERVYEDRRPTLSRSSTAVY